MLITHCSLQSLEPIHGSPGVPNIAKGDHNIAILLETWQAPLTPNAGIGPEQWAAEKHWSGGAPMLISRHRRRKPSTLDSKQKSQSRYPGAERRSIKWQNRHLIKEEINAFLAPMVWLDVGKIYRSY